MRKTFMLGMALALLLSGPVLAAGGNELQYKKIQDLTTLAPTAINGADYVPVYDASTGVTSKVLASGFATPGALVALDVSTGLTAAIHANKTLVLGGAGSARTMTLPAATGTGARYRFVVGAVNTSNYVIQVTGDDTIDGGIAFNSDNASEAMVGFETAADSDTITLNGTTKGGQHIGDVVEVQDIAADQYTVTGLVTESGSEATPFSAAVP